MTHHLKLVLATALILAGSAACSANTGDKAADELQRVMTVSGHGEARHAPDMATASAGVRTQGTTAQQALQVNTQDMNKVFATLKSLGIADADIQTSNFSVQPLYEQAQPGQQQNGPPRIVGYQVFNQVTVTLRDLTKLGAALDALVASGANEMYGVNFGIADTDPLTDEARDAAIKDAMRKAALMAKSAGVRLGRIMSISESSAGPPVPMYAARAKMASTETVPTAAGEQVLAADASLVFEIE